MDVPQKHRKWSHTITCIIFPAGCPNPEVGKMLKDLIQTDYFRVVVVKDVSTVEICGALKVGENIH